MDFLSVYKRHRPELDRVEKLLAEAVQSRNTDLTDAALQLLHAGGKRIRPLFAIVCSHFGTPNVPEVYEVAAALELIHMATLVHDDVIDNADRRRGAPTVRARYGNRPAMYAGDFLFARGISLLARVGRTTVHQELAEAMVRMCQGEIEQIQDFYNWNQSLKRYLRRVERKTALLIAVSCALGATVADAPGDVVNRLRRFGYLTGMAFQITDDVLDFTADPEVVGKPVGGDLRQGNLTLPALHAAQQGHGATLERLVQRGGNSQDVEQALEIIRASDALTYAMKVANRYLDKSLRLLDELDSNPAAEDLRVIAQFVNQRKY
jgi:heptaprenyl diphosphate synthase